MQGLNLKNSLENHSSLPLYVNCAEALSLKENKGEIARLSNNLQSKEIINKNL